MGWSANFLLEINKRIYSPRFLLETVNDVEFKPGSGLALSSHPTAGYRTAITLEGSRVAAGQLSVGDWSYSVPEVTIGIDTDVSQLVARGQLLVLRVGWPGWSPGDYEPVFYGHLQSVDRSGDDWTLTIRSILASLVSRMTSEAVDIQLFGDLASSEVASAAYVAGAASIRVDNGSTAELEGGAGAKYLLQVFGDDGEPFFLLADALDTSPVGYDRFDLNPTTAILGTTAAAAAIGQEVRYCAMVYDSPTRAVRRFILTKNGDSVNGLYDTLPPNWGLGIPMECVDDDDIDITKAIVAPASAPTSKWYVCSAEPQDDGLSWIQSVLNPAGMFLCVRQGLLTIRAVSPCDRRQYAMSVVNDRDIQSIRRHERWNTATPVEYGFLSVTAASSTFGSNDSENLDSRPASGEYAIDLDYVHDDDTAWEVAVIDRLLPWYTRLTEIIDITCIGLRLAFLAPGDLIQLDTRHVRTRDRATFPMFFLLAVDVDWFEGTVSMIAAYHPSSPNEF